jgi:hypothetical protein
MAVIYILLIAVLSCMFFAYFSPNRNELLFRFQAVSPQCGGASLCSRPSGLDSLQPIDNEYMDSVPAHSRLNVYLYIQ